MNGPIRRFTHTVFWAGVDVTLLERLENDLKDAMRAGDRARVSSIRLSLASIRNAAIEKRRPLNDSEVVSVLQKEAKSHRESIEEFRNGNRPDLVAKEEAELAVVEEYLPQQMPREEVVDLARRVIDEVGATGPRDMGKVMPRMMAAVAGRADGKMVSQVVQELLAGR